MIHFVCSELTTYKWGEKMENVRYMNYKQTKEYLNVKSYATIHKLIDQGLRVSVINGVKRFDRLDVDEFMNSKKIGDKN
jgi:hypothetical protein